MEDSWIYVNDEDGVSSSNSVCDSDQIDSETEAELYSKIHYEENLSGVDCSNVQNVTSEAPKLFIYAQDKINNVFHADKDRDSCQESTEEKVFPNVEYRQKMKKSSDRLSVRMSQSHLDSAKMQRADIDEISLSSDDPNSTDESSKRELSSKQNKNVKFSPNKRRKFHKESHVVVIDSSDSEDNFRWSEQEFYRKANLEMNLVNDANKTSDSNFIYLSSSDSDSEQNVSSSVMKRDSILKNVSMPNIKIGETSKDLWSINSEDLHRQKKSSRRYHDSFDITCSNCHKKGHSHRACPLPKVVRCFICGGEHVGSRCASRVCSNCFAAGHERRKCWKRSNESFCCVCNMRGHMKETCPDLWRRYHLTTDSVNITKGKKSKQISYLYCWNCGNGGHFGAQCPRLHSSKYVFSTWPCVVSYSSPKNLLRKRASIIQNTRKDFGRSEVPQRYGNTSAQISNKKYNFQFQPKNKSNVGKDNNKKKAKKIGSKKKIRKINKLINRTERLIKETDFPRTPKKKNPFPEFADEEPALIIAEMKRKQQMKEYRLKKRLYKLIEMREQEKQKQILQNIQSIN